MQRGLSAIAELFVVIDIIFLIFAQTARSVAKAIIPLQIVLTKTQVVKRSRDQRSRLSYFINARHEMHHNLQL